MNRASSQRPRVVLVEDDIALRGALSFALDTEGYEVRGFDTAEAALAANFSAACLIIDYRLPAATGLTLLEHFRARGGKTPAILITSHPPTFVTHYAELLGAVVIEKPLLSDDLVEAVRRLAPILDNSGQD